ncbi:MAG: Aspartyl/glutamyl-tRNA(Asn/Gln) amidotransferase subunit B [Alphaproteobacteria bacterium MarineAlpha6_Bin6]|mgnify:FL=1|nr:MAG: Aspartyl/glutamyl-tRNA(Asn/Gln) amidotransferase subunit B [Alphaproteobacteria bacterium MarineAlpha6_Bin6]PPR32478.1 MAG: Aspartyl/glutamyl-tRNA(Asn/Gln) amidotransferase subunit B [Alphaproteobacteria bacterium MarineAlpha6_Bin5]|tara:strand:- start:18 stop:1463 length:1446 start_codon:yes stop_codon:yes gene_type:complete
MNLDNWETIIGLEVHAQIISKSKLFSGASTNFGSEPNTQVSLVDAAMPGMLPVINKDCVEQAIKTGLGLNAKINKRSVFDRKNYFYPDLPQGYQISQFTQPIVGEGSIEIDLKDGSSKKIGITRLHLEQDAGKSVHDIEPTKSYIDLNRSGVALMEIVSEPDIRSAEEAQEYVKKLRSILRYIGTCDGNMEEGSLRCDVNISVRKKGDELGTRAEIKNVNSIKSIGQAIDYEFERQTEIINSGGKVDQETRLFDEKKGETRSMRSKEEAHDYRYFPDPDLPPLEFSDDWIDEIKKNLPELPDVKKENLIDEYKISSYDASILVSDKNNVEFFDKIISENKKRNPKNVANWIIGELFALLNKNNLEIKDSPIKTENLGELIDYIEDQTISGKIAKTVFEEMFNTKKRAKDIIEKKGLKQITDKSEIESLIDKVLENNKDKVDEYKSGKEKLFGYFVGQVMQETKGTANPGIVNDILKKKLAK